MTASAPKPKKKIEYIMHVHQIPDNKTGKNHVVFDLQTTKEFSSFRYELAVQASYDPDAREFSFHIGGMNAPVVLMPGAGSARGAHRYDDIKHGLYTVKIVKPPRQANTFSLKLSKNDIAFSRRASKTPPFIEIRAGEPEPND